MGLEAHGGIRLLASQFGGYAGLHDGVAAVIAQGPQLSVQHHPIFQAFLPSPNNHMIADSLFYKEAAVGLLHENERLEYELLG